MTTSVSSSAATRKSPGARIVVPLLVGSAVSVALGAYGGAHSPTGRSVTMFGCSSVITMKVWLTP